LEFLVFNQLARNAAQPESGLQSLELMQTAQTARLSRRAGRGAGGRPLGVALSGLPSAGLFPRPHRSPLMAGERSGGGVVLGRYITYQQMIEAVGRRVKSALTCRSSWSSRVQPRRPPHDHVIEVRHVLSPVFAPSCPIPTQIVIGVATFLLNNIVYILAGLAALVWYLRRQVAPTPAGWCSTG
jgi:type II secretory pathway component PulF